MSSARIRFVYVGISALVLFVLFTRFAVQTSPQPSDLTSVIGDVTFSRIVNENALKGSDDWWQPYVQQNRDGLHPRFYFDTNVSRKIDDASISLEGYSTRFSVLPGETVRFKVDHVRATNQSRSTNITFSMAIYRLGYYAGSGARRVGSAPLSVAPHGGRWSQHRYHSVLAFENERWEHSQPECLYASGTHTVDCANWHDSAVWEVPADAR